MPRYGDNVADRQEDDDDSDGDVDKYQIDERDDGDMQSLKRRLLLFSLCLSQNSATSKHKHNHKQTTRIVALSYQFVIKGKKFKQDRITGLWVGADFFSFTLHKKNSARIFNRTLHSSGKYVVGGKSISLI